MGTNDNDLRMEAYYYEFTKTGVPAIDRILSAVACAGKAFHNTSEWCEKVEYPYQGCEGESPIDWIQNAANDAAKNISRADTSCIVCNGESEKGAYCPKCGDILEGNE